MKGFLAPDPDLTITVNRSDLNRVMMGLASFDQLADEGKARLKGDSAIIQTLRELMVPFTPDFEILPGTAPTRRQVPPGREFALPDPVEALKGGA
jgi:alkyl sulfatase BDS1-like metallo-beta-lactamase superfamily hydrolase